MEISKELLSEVLGEEVESFSVHGYILEYSVPLTGFNKAIGIHELSHKNLKQWAKLNNVFDIIDWSGEPEEIFAKAEELRNEIS